MEPIIPDVDSALDVHTFGKIGTFRVSKNGSFVGIEVKYMLTHVTLSSKQSQSSLLDMLAPVREVFDIKQLEFDEIMQRDIDDARVSLDLIPYLLDSSTSGQIKLFPPIVAVVLPLKKNSKNPDSLYKKVQPTQNTNDKNKLIEKKLTAGDRGDEQFEFTEYYVGENPANAQGKLSLSRDNCALAIVDGQHRAMALLALHRNLTSGWTDAKRNPFEHYYKVWTDKEIRSYNLDELQLPIIICTFPQLDGTNVSSDVVKAARRVFLTLNKNAKPVSDARNKILNDQDIVSECLRDTLSEIKQLDAKDQTGLRMWNIEIDPEKDKVKIGSEVALSGVSHIYSIAEHILMSQDDVYGVEARARSSGLRKKLDMAYVRLELKDELDSIKRDANSRTNYSDDIATLVRKKWRSLYGSAILDVFGKFHPFAAFSAATINLQQKLRDSHELQLEKMLFDGQAISKTVEEFRDGLQSRIDQKEPGWSSPEILETQKRFVALLEKKRQFIDVMKSTRAERFLGSLSPQGLKKVQRDGKIAKQVTDLIDRIYSDVLTTIAFQSAIVCTYTEAMRKIYSLVSSAPKETLDEYINAINSFFAPKAFKDFQRILRIFEGSLDEDLKFVSGGPLFRYVVMTGEMQPSEWPKYRYLLLEIWTSADSNLGQYFDQELVECRECLRKSLNERKIRQYCSDNLVAPQDLTEEIVERQKLSTKSDLEAFLEAVRGKRFALPSLQS